MKKQWIAAALALSVSGFTFADGGPGCGAGSMVFKGQSGIAPHVLAATTNGISGNQTFGMTTGTLGCNPHQPIKSMASMFIDENMDQIAKDMSRGEGQHLETLATLLEMNDADRAGFKAAMQNHFGEIYTHADVTSSEVVENMADVMRKDASLEKYLG